MTTFAFKSTFPWRARCGGGSPCGVWTLDFVESAWLNNFASPGMGKRFQQIPQFVLDCFGGINGSGDLCFDEFAEAPSQSVNSHLSGAL